MLWFRIVSACVLAWLAATAFAAEPLHQRIDSLIRDGHNGPVADRSTDAEFHRRVWLDLAGMFPSTVETRAFLADSAADKRGKLIDRLLTGPHYPIRMRHAFSVMLLERRVADADWDRFLETSFRDNKPLDHLVRELISADGTDSATRPAMQFWLTRSATDHRLLARDASRLLLGRNLECAQCHDHPSIDDFKQAEFFGLVAFLNRSYLYKDKKTNQTFFVEKGTGPKEEFTSVFTSKSDKTGPRLLRGMEIMVPEFASGEDLATPATDGRPPLPKFPLRAQLARRLASRENSDFARNMANRLWAMLLGRGLVHPLDMQHAKNPPSHPELLQLLSDELVSHGFDMKYVLKQLALSETYQRSSRLGDSADAVKSQTYAAFEMRSLSAEQLAYSVMQSLGTLDRILQAPADLVATAKYRPDKGDPIPTENLDNVLKLFQSIYASQPGETEDGFNPSLAASLFIANEKLLLKWLEPQDGSLTAKLVKTGDGQLADELYVAVLSRRPTQHEEQSVQDFLAKHPDGRQAAIREMTWALLASAEFRFNH